MKIYKHWTCRPTLWPHHNTFLVIENLRNFPSALHSNKKKGPRMNLTYIRHKDVKHQDGKSHKYSHCLRGPSTSVCLLSNYRSAKVLWVSQGQLVQSLSERKRWKTKKRQTQGSISTCATRSKKKVSHTKQLVTSYLALCKMSFSFETQRRSSERLLVSIIKYCKDKEKTFKRQVWLGPRSWWYWKWVAVTANLQGDLMSVHTHSVPAGICEFTDDSFTKSTLWAPHLHCWANLRAQRYITLFVQ